MIHPEDNFILCQPVKGSDRTRGGIFLPGSASERFLNKGIIISIGPECDKGMIPGDTIIFAPHAEYLIEDEKTGTKYVLVRQNEVIATELDDSKAPDGSVTSL